MTSGILFAVLCLVGILDVIRGCTVAYCPYCMSSSFCCCSEHFDVVFAECESRRIVVDSKLITDIDRKIGEIDRQRDRKKAAV